MIDNLGYIEGAKNLNSGCSRSGLLNHITTCQHTLGLSEVINASVSLDRKAWGGCTRVKPFATPKLFCLQNIKAFGIKPWRHNMCNNTVPITVQDRIADVSESIKFITKSIENESGQLGQVSCLLSVLSASLQDAWTDLSEYTFENRIGYPDAN